MARGDKYPVVYVDGDVPQLPIQLGQLLVDSSQISVGVTNLQQCTSQDPLVYEGVAGYYRRTAAEILAGVVPTNYSIPSHVAVGWVAVDRYGGDNTGVASSTTALNNAVLVSAAAYQATVRFNCGMYRFATKPSNIGYGIMVEFPGSQGTTTPYGGILLADYDTDDLLVWDGSGGGANARGTGGGLKNCLVLAASGHPSPAGRGIYLYAISSNMRPGEMVFQNVGVFGQGAATWTKCIEIDGRNANTAGSRGVRTVRFDKVRCADATTAYQTVHIRQGTHISGQIDIDTGNGTLTPGLTLDDIWDNVTLSECRLTNVVVNYTGASNPTLMLNCRVASFDNTSDRVVGTAFLADYGALSNASRTLKIVANNADAFSARLSATVTDQTGGGAGPITVVFDTEAFDDNSVYDNATGVFTAKCAGYYHFDYAVTLGDCASSGATRATLNLLHQDSGASTVTSVDTQGGNVTAIADSADTVTIGNSILLRLDEGDTVQVRVTATGGTDTIDFVGGATNISWFCGRLLA